MSQMYAQIVSMTVASKYPSCSCILRTATLPGGACHELHGVYSLSFSFNCYYLACSTMSEQLLCLCFRSLGSSQISKHCNPDKQTAHMSGRQLEAWWALSPQDLAIVQADPALGPTHLSTGTLMPLQKLKPLPSAKEDLSFCFAYQSIPNLHAAQGL